MFKFVTNVTRTSWTISQSSKFNFERLFASFTMRDMLHQSSDEVGTLLVRFAKHIAIECQKTAPLVPTTINYADYFPLSNLSYFQKELQKTTADQLPYLIIFAFTYRSNADPAKFASVLNDIDALAMKRLAKMDMDTVYRTLYALLFLMPNWITRMDFYGAAVKRLVSEFSDNAEKEKFVQLCFYLGLDKKHHQAPGSGSALLKRLLTEHLQKYLPQLSLMDLAIVSNAAFKTATRLENSSYNEHLIEKTLSLPQDNTQDDLLVTFLKAMRLERIRSDQVCEYLEKICENPDNLRSLQARGLIHIFAYFAENLWDKNDCILPLFKEFIQRLKQTKKFQTVVEPLRPKDIEMFVWCSAQLNISPSDADLQQIERVLLEKNRHNEFKYFPDQLVDSCLHLWILGCKSRQLLDETIYHKGHVRSSGSQQPKVDSRYTVLLSTVAIEEPTWLNNVKDAPTAPFSTKQPLPAHLAKMQNQWKKYTEQLSSEESISDVRMVCPIKGINIPSVYVKFSESENESVFIEFLTNEQMLRFSESPTAILRLKVRLLKALGHKVILLRPQDLPENIKKLKNRIPATDASEDVKQESVGAI